MKKAFYLLTTKEYLNSKQRYERSELIAKIALFVACHSMILVLFIWIVWSV